jgi:hypothetical protein
MAREAVVSPLSAMYGRSAGKTLILEAAVHSYSEPGLRERAAFGTKPSFLARHLNDGSRREQTLQLCTAAIVEWLSRGR